MNEMMLNLKRGRFRVKGDVVDVFPSWDETAIGLNFLGMTLIAFVHCTLSGEVLGSLDAVDIFPASHYVVEGGMDDALLAIEDELNIQHQHFLTDGRLVEAQRIKSTHQL